MWVGNCLKKCAVGKNKKHRVGLSVGFLVLSIFRFSVLSQWFTFQFFDVSLFPTLGGNGWGCGKCGRACYVFVTRRKRPSGRNRSEVPVSTHIGYTPCYRLFFLFLLCQYLFFNKIFQSVF